MTDVPVSRGIEPGGSISGKEKKEGFLKLDWHPIDRWRSFSDRGKKIVGIPVAVGAVAAAAAGGTLLYASRREAAAVERATQVASVEVVLRGGGWEAEMATGDKLANPEDHEPLTDQERKSYGLAVTAPDEVTLYCPASSAKKGEKRPVPIALHDDLSVTADVIDGGAIDANGMPFGYTDEDKTSYDLANPDSKAAFLAATIGKTCTPAAEAN